MRWFAAPVTNAVPAREMRVRSVRYSECSYALAVAAGHPSLNSHPTGVLASRLRQRSKLSDQGGCKVKGSQKPKKLGKKPAQKTLKERRTAKRAAAKHASRGLDV